MHSPIGSILAPALRFTWVALAILAAPAAAQIFVPADHATIQAAIDAAIEAEPYESNVGCAFPASDVHTGVHSGLVERAPEVTEFLANMFIGALPLVDLAAWKNDNNKEWNEAAVYWIKNSEATWNTWVNEDAAKKVKEALDKES